MTHCLLSLYTYFKLNHCLLNRCLTCCNSVGVFRKCGFTTITKTYLYGKMACILMEEMLLESANIVAEYSGWFS